MTIPPVHAVADHGAGLLLDVRRGPLAAPVAARVARAVAARPGFTIDTAEDAALVGAMLVQGAGDAPTVRLGMCSHAAGVRLEVGPLDDADTARARCGVPSAGATLDALADVAVERRDGGEYLTAEVRAARSPPRACAPARG